MKKLLFLITILFFSQKIIAQNCPTTPLFFTDQQQIDNFPSNYPNCSVIESGIFIQEFISGNIKNLDSLFSIQSINNFFQIVGNDSLNNLNGLENLTYIGFLLNIESNPNLESLSGLFNLDTVGGSLTISNNKSISHLEGLENLSLIGDQLTIEKNNALIDLDGLEEISLSNSLLISENNSLENINALINLVEIGGSLSIRENPFLINLSGLENVETVGGILVVSKNQSLENLNGLNSLNSIEESLFIYENQSLNNLNGFENLTSIGGHLTIANNLNLTSLDGIENISPASIESNSGAEDIEIYNNPNLIFCSVLSICEKLQDSLTSTDIYNNGLGCQNKDEIEFFCLYTDEDGDGFFSDVDCNDSDSLIYPGAQEIPNNGIDEDCDELDLIVAVDNLTELKIKIAPNPVTEFVNISLPQLPNTTAISISNYNGKILSKFKYSNENSIHLDLSDLSSGVYFLIIKNSNKKIYKKFVKI